MYIIIRFKRGSCYSAPAAGGASKVTIHISVSMGEKAATVGAESTPVKAQKIFN
jgi:hypothetical protein